MQVLAIVLYLGTAAAQIATDLGRLDILDDHKKYMLRKRFRPIYHISAPMGWLTEVSALTYFHDQYHVFYQYHPYNGAWGYVHWGHVVSDDLVDWVHYPTALIPKEFYEKNGCLSGSALVHNEYLAIFYTGSVHVRNRTVQNQNIAISSDGIIFQKYLYNPVVKESPYSQQGFGEFKGPKVWRYRNQWYMLLGVMSPELQGQLYLYTSHDLFNWKINGTIAHSLGDMGYMWESPDYFELDGMNVLMLSVRGIQTDGNRFRNLFQTGYILGELNYRTLRFDQPFELSTATFFELDFGHDFFGARAMRATDGRTLLVAWLGMEESSFEEAKDGWASMLTIVRELKLNLNGRILMQPVREIAELRIEKLEEAWYSPGEAFLAGCRSFELLVNSSVGANDVSLALELGGNQMYAIRYFASKAVISVDRGGMDGIRRADWSPVGDYVYWRIFVDHSSIEIFCGTGEVVFSSRIYPKKGIRVNVGGDTQLHIIQYKLRRNIGYTKRIRKHLVVRDRQGNLRASKRAIKRRLAARKKIAKLI